MDETSIRDHYAPALRRVPGIVVAVHRNGQTKVVALGSIEHESDPSRLCWEIGSITKVMTGVLLADASLRGEVRLDDPIGRFLPNDVVARLPEPDDQPRLVDLATHRSGLPGLPLQLLRTMWRSDDPYARLTEQDIFDCLGSRTRRPRHSRYRYSNLGMGLLGHLLAAAAGRPYAAMLEDRLLAPLGMLATGVGHCDAVKTVVPGYRKGRPTPPWTMGALQGAGAVQSTAADLVTFAMAHLGPPAGLLGEALALAASPVQRSSSTKGVHGLGWMIRTRGAHQRKVDDLWHNGGTYGGSSFLAVDRTSRIALVALGNAGPRLSAPLDAPSWGLFDQLER